MEVLPHVALEAALDGLLQILVTHPVPNRVLVMILNREITMKSWIFSMIFSIFCLRPALIPVLMTSMSIIPVAGSVAADWVATRIRRKASYTSEDSTLTLREKSGLQIGESHLGQRLRQPDEALQLSRGGRDDVLAHAHPAHFFVPFHQFITGLIA